MTKNVGKKKKKTSFNFGKENECQGKCDEDKEQPTIPQSKKRKSIDSYEKRKKKRKLSMKRLRDDQSYTERERLKNVLKKREVRDLLASKEENIKNQIRIKRLRTTERYSEKEKGKNALRVRELRQTEKFRENENEKNMARNSELRQNEVYRLRENYENIIRNRILRENEDFKKNEEKQNLERIKKLRLAEEFREKENEKNTVRNCELRHGEEYRLRENDENINRNKILRENEDFKKNEQKQNLERIKKLRLAEEFREKENEKNMVRNIELRQSEKYREAENEKNMDRNIELRQSEKYREAENEKNMDRNCELRHAEEYRLRENDENINRNKILRENEDFKKNEQKQNLKRIEKLRQDGEFREKENEKNISRNKQLRQTEDYRQNERARNSERMEELRENEDFKQKEIFQDRINKHKERSNSIIRFRHSYYNTLTQSGSICSKLILQFLAERKNVPEYICCCCEGLFFAHSVSKFANNSSFRKKSENQDNFYEKIKNFPSEFICNTCKIYVKKSQVPKLATSNGLKFRDVPECLKSLSPLEERLCSPFIPFMQIRPLKAFAINPQLGLKGSVVNIPIDINECLHVLPRSFDNMATLQLQLKRHLSHKTYYMFETIRPALVCEALKFLIKTPLYLKNEIDIDLNYLKRYDSQYLEEQKFVLNEIESLPPSIKCTMKEINQEDCIQESDDKTQNDTSIIESDDEFGEEILLIDNNENVKIIAPGQNQSPIAWHLVDDIDELCFPKIFCGHPFQLSKKTTYHDRAKSECRRVDRRSCIPSRVLFMAKKKIEKQCIANINVCLRKTKKKVADLRAKNLLDEMFVNNLINVDSGYRVLKNVRSSPAFWENKKKDLLAMIRQLKKPTFFLTLSAAESRWPELISYLSKINNNKNLSVSEALELSDFEKSNLIQNDPVSCARYFDYKISKFIKLIKQENGIFEDYTVEDSYQRVEFQMRGSPHEHMFLWLKNAPVYDGTNPEAVIDFVDKYITCEYQEDDPYIALQKHKHTHTCRKGKRSKKVCRFNFPLPVLPRTMILTPLSKEEESDSIKSIFSKIDKLMNYFFKKQEMMTFQEVLAKLEVNEEQYILALRSSIKTTRLFLKRSTMEVGINGYNKHILHSFESNMDIQFVLEEFGLASYIVNYVSKAEAGLSKLLRNAAKEMEGGNIGLREQFRKISNVFLNCHLMSAQEASYLILSLPVSKSSRRVIFINTSPQCERVLMLKSKALLNQLPPDSEDVFMDDLVEKYMKRPNSLENICLAEYVACFYSKPSQKVVENENDDQCEEPTMIRKRSQPAVIRFRRYKLNLDPKNFYREQVLLLLPFRNEKVEIEERDCQQLYFQHLETIDLNQGKFNIVADDPIEEAIDILQKKDDDSLVEEDQFPETVDIFVQGGVEGNNNDINNNNNNNNRLSIPKRINVKELRKMLKSLNIEQNKIVMHILDSFKRNELPFNIFLSGSAGVGKSTVIKVIYQSVTHYFDELPGSNKDRIVVLLCAPSGKAAFLIHGVTLHTAFALPVAQFSGNMPQLSSDVANSLRQKLINMKLLIIDEISMVGSKLLCRVDCRLRQIMGCNLPFGGVSVLVVGDLHQLPPVMDSPVFKFPSINDLERIVDRNPLWDEFSFYELKQVMRQKDDIQFINVLNNIAVGQVSTDDENLINSRRVGIDEVPNNVIRLFSKNEDVDEHNFRKIKESPGKTFLSLAEDHVLGRVSNETKTRILNSIKKKKTTEMNGLSHEIQLKVGLKYMITANIDVEDGLVNGACGTLEKIIFRPNSEIPFKVFIDFNEERVGCKARLLQKSFMMNQGINSNLTPVDRSRQILNFSNKLEKQVVRNQFPLISAEAITIHKSQGQTYNEICLDFTKLKRITKSMLYVALSRVKSLSGLHIIGEFKKLKVHKREEPAMIELSRLRENKMLKLLPDSVKMNNSKPKIVTKNQFVTEIELTQVEETGVIDLEVEGTVHKILSPDYYLQDDDIQRFHDIISENTEYHPQSTLLVQIPELIQSRRGTKNVQLLYHRLDSMNEFSSIGHWICSYYDGNAIHIYDSMNLKNLHHDCSIYLDRLYGDVPITFHKVQQQTNGYDCGVYAIAFAVSICLNKNPSQCSYKESCLRSHCLEIMNQRRLLPFPPNIEQTNMNGSLCNVLYSA